MIRTLVFAFTLLSAGSALASNCRPISPLDKRGPAVWVLGYVTKVTTQNKPGTTLELNLDKGHGTNTATVRVDRALKGNVGREVEIRAEMDDGSNAGFSFKEGPIIVGAARQTDGSLVSSTCSLVAVGDAVNDINWDGDQFRNQEEADTVELSKIANRIHDMGDPTHTNKLREDDVRTLNSLFSAIGDHERRIAMLEDYHKDKRNPESGARLALAYLDGGRYLEARNLALEASAGGAENADIIWNTAKLLLGEPADTRRASFKGRSFGKLDLSFSSLEGRDVSGIEVKEILTHETDLKGVDLSGARIGGGSLAAANLAGAKLRNARVARTSVRGAVMKDAEIDGLRVEAVDGGPDLSGARGSKPFFGGDLGGGRFDGATIPGARFLDAQLDGASLKNADLSGAVFEGGSVRAADLTGAKLEGTSWNGTYYDCDTRFPAGFDPKANGLVGEGGC